MSNSLRFSEKLPVAIFVGSRAEAVKLAPLILELEDSDSLKPLTICITHPSEKVHGIFRSFGITPDLHLNGNGSPLVRPEPEPMVSATLAQVLETHKVSAVVVQGDSPSALEASYAAIHKRVPIAHVEAGLRTGNRHAPFPEEINRSMIARLADWHFAPTSAQGETLRDENISADSIFVCGNTVVDALEWMQDKLRCRELPSGIANGTRKLVLATCHRRENFGIPMRSIALAIKHLADGHPDTHFILPMHPHPAVREAIVPILKKQNGVTLCEPLDYPEFLSALQQAYLVLTDSGGVQEEACTLGKPLLILRNETERTEGIDVGNQRLVGTLVQDILEETHELLVNEDAYRAMKIPSNIYGDGHASERITCILEEKIQSPNRIANFRKEGRTELTLLH